VPENSAAPSENDAITPPRAIKAQVIHLDASKTLALFGSEQRTAEQKTAERPSELLSVAPIHDPPRRAADPTTIGDHARTAKSPSVDRSGVIGVRSVLVAVLVIVVVAQGAFIAREVFWSTPAAAAPETGTLRVSSDPVGAPVVIDGTARGITPLEIDLPPGAHSVEVGSGAQARSQSVTINRGGTFAMHQGLTVVPVATKFEPGTGGLQIATEPPGARVSVDGTSQGIAPVTVMNLKVGDHVVTVRGNAGEPVNRTVQVSEANMTSLVVAITPPTGFASGWIALNSSIPLQILERGTIVGTSDTPRILLPTGAHELELVNTELGFRTTRSVQVVAGETAAVPVKLPMGAISINALPWAEVWVDGQPAGETPIGNFSVTIGRHELIFRHPELGEQRRSVTVGVNNPVRVSVDLRKK
jgi:hypothetical protein